MDAGCLAAVIQLDGGGLAGVPVTGMRMRDATLQEHDNDVVRRAVKLRTRSVLLATGTAQ